MSGISYNFTLCFSITILRLYLDVFWCSHLLWTSRVFHIIGASTATFKLSESQTNGSNTFREFAEFERYFCPSKKLRLINKRNSVLSIVLI